MITRSELHRRREGASWQRVRGDPDWRHRSVVLCPRERPASSVRFAPRHDDADLAILAQPYLAPTLRRIAPDLAFVYDSQNAEYSMKQAMLVGVRPLGAELAEAVRLVEIEAVASAELVTVCSN